MFFFFLLFPSQKNKHNEKNIFEKKLRAPLQNGKKLIFTNFFFFKWP